MSGAAEGSQSLGGHGPAARDEKSGAGRSKDTGEAENLLCKIYVLKNFILLKLLNIIDTSYNIILAEFYS